MSHYELGFVCVAYAASFEQPGGMGEQLAEPTTSLESCIKQVATRIGSVFFLLLSYKVEGTHISKMSISF